MAMVTGRIQDSLLLVEFRDHLSRNSFSIRAAEELLNLLESKKGSFEALLFSAPGRVFCSGGNLADYAAMTAADPGRDVNRRIADVLANFNSLPVPTVCMVHGDCFGGGLELISAFDVVLSSPFALFGFWQRKVGLTFGWGGGARLEKRLGEKKLKQLALSTATFGALEAHRIGLVDGVLMEALLFDEATKRARDLMRLPKAPVAALKALDAGNERATFDRLWWNDEHQAALSQRKSK